MGDKRSKTKFDAAIEVWQAAMDGRQYRIALRAAIDAYLQGEVEGNEVEARAAMGRIHLSTSELIFGQHSDTRSRLSCSFCGQSGSDVRLGAGPDVFICADCVGIFYEEAGLKPDKRS
jgi:hypothetical protein